TARPDGAILTQFAARSALSSSSHNGRASSDPGATWPSNSWPANFCSAEATRLWPSGGSVRGVFNFASSSSASRARSRASERSALLPKRVTPRPASTIAMKSKASPFCRRGLRSSRRMTATVPINPVASNAYPQLRQNSGSALPRKRSLMRGGARGGWGGRARGGGGRGAGRRQQGGAVGDGGRAGVGGGKEAPAFEHARDRGGASGPQAAARPGPEGGPVPARLDEEIVDAVV